MENEPAKRANKAQKDMLINFITSNPVMVNGKSQLEGVKRLWAQLVSELNEKGVKKTQKQWLLAYKAMMKKTKAVARKSYASKKKTGGGISEEAELTPQQTKMLSSEGPACISGLTGIPEAGCSSTVWRGETIVWETTVSSPVPSPTYRDDATSVAFWPEPPARLQTPPIVATPAFSMPESGLLEVPLQERSVPPVPRLRAAPVPAAPVRERSATPVPAIHRATPVGERLAAREPTPPTRRAAVPTTPRARIRARANADPGLAEVMRSNTAIARSLDGIGKSIVEAVKMLAAANRHCCCCAHGQNGRTPAKCPSDGANAVIPEEPREPEASRPGFSGSNWSREQSNWLSENDDA